jgi:hypothetical protein
VANALLDGLPYIFPQSLEFIANSDNLVILFRLALRPSRALQMPRIPYRFPAKGEDEVADRIRERRGARGLTSLDGTLLNAPMVADGWNTFIGTLRQRNSLPDDIREILVSAGAS